ncbi:MAG TPA: dihydrofolate reductase family protein, partial [Candidatus Solibacter sp.]|nr:dihydrofolate reductase family protein [Candidatus Solibacter sp.]
DRPWIYANFVQSLDGVASFKGRHPTGADISQSAEDRWLMDLLRAHADGVLMGINTLVEETTSSGNRGPVYQIDDPMLRQLRTKLGLQRERIIFVTSAARLDLSAFRVFDGDLVDAMIITTTAGSIRLAEQNSHPHIHVIGAGTGETVDLREAVRILRRGFGVRRLLCEGGPTLYGHMSGAGLIDEKFVTVSPVEIGILIPAGQVPSDAEKSNPPKQRPTTFMAPGFVKENAPWYRWVSCRRIGNHQFSRYRRSQ